MTDAFGAAVGFVIALIVSTLVIFIVTKLTGETEGLGTALVVTIVGIFLPTLGGPL